MAIQRKRKIEKGLVDGRLSSSIWKLAAPMMIGGALDDLFSMVDLFFVGNWAISKSPPLPLQGLS